MTPQTDLLRVLVMAESPFVRAGIVSLLNDQPGIDVVGQIPADSSWADMVQLYAPQVIIWDPAYDGDIESQQFEALREIDIPVLALVSQSDRALSILAAGARGLVLSNVDLPALLAALRALAQGLAVFDSEFLTLVESSAPAPTPLTAEIMTTREMEVLNMLAEGLANKQIALRLNISEHTVKFHVNAIMTKLNVQSRTEAVVQATRRGLISL
ncbi:MAG: response regulator transcription factor [Anaerolineae bacterium]|nr:response regulator transcription factor [Anaerolineae bacterium]MCA9908859.1 response regulator transcription factor [Anaerolineae bacterium]